VIASTPHTAPRRPAAHRLGPAIAIAVLVALLAPAQGARQSNLVALATAEGAPGPNAAFRIIVNPANPATVVDRAFVAQAFLKKVRRWPDGLTIQPVDLTRDSMVRRQWSLDLLGRSVEAVKNYWQQLIFAGRDLPPPELPSEGDVVLYVLHNPGAIGYVSGAVPLHGAKVLGFQ